MQIFPEHLCEPRRLSSWEPRSLMFRSFNPGTSSGGGARQGSLPVTHPQPQAEAAFLCLLSQLRWPAPVHPISRSRQTVQEPMKPLHPTSMWHIAASQSTSLHSAVTSEYCAHFYSWAASRPSSHGTVSSARRTILLAMDHVTMSGRRDVSVISLGN